MKERRNAYRFRTLKNPVYLKPAYNGSRARVVDISSKGVGFILKNGQMDLFPDKTIFLKLPKHPAIETRIVTIHYLSDGEGVRAGVHFRDMNFIARRFLYHFLIQQFIKTPRNIDASAGTGPKIVKENLRDIYNLIYFHCNIRSQPIFFYKNADTPPLELTIKHFNNDSGRLLIHLKPSYRRKMTFHTGKKYAFSFPGTNAVNHFVTRVLRIESKSLIIKMPDCIYQSGFRNSLRFSSHHGGEETAHIKHPLLSGVVLSKPILNIGANGVSFPLSPDSDMLSPGEKLSNIAINLPSGIVQAAGTIRNVHKKGAGISCGLEITRFKKQNDEEQWRRHALLKACQRLAFAEKKDASEAWQVLEASKYLELVIEPLRALFKKRFFESWERHSENPDVFRSLILYEKEKPVATFSANLFYPRTSIGHHFSIDGTIRRNIFDIGRELCSGLVYVLQHMVPTEYFICYVDAKKMWNDLMYGRFLNIYPAQSDYIYDRFHVYKCRMETTPEHDGIVNKMIDVSLPKPHFLNHLCDYFSDNHQEMEIEAFSWKRDEIELKDFTQKCGGWNYDRKRYISFAVQNREPVAALIAETGEEGLNLFSLFNACRIIFIKSEMRKDDRVIECLLHDAKRFYRANHKAEFMLLTPFSKEPGRHFEPFGYHYVTDVMRWVGRNKMLAAHLNYIEESLGIKHNRIKLH